MFAVVILYQIFCIRYSETKRLLKKLFLAITLFGVFIVIFFIQVFELTFHNDERIYPLEIENNEPGYSIVAIEYHILDKIQGSLYEKKNFLILRKIVNSRYGTTDSLSPIQTGDYTLSYNSETKKLDFLWRVEEGIDYYQHYVFGLQK